MTSLHAFFVGLATVLVSIAVFVPLVVNPLQSDLGAVTEAKSKLESQVTDLQGTVKGLHDQLRLAKEGHEQLQRQHKVELEQKSAQAEDCKALSSIMEQTSTERDALRARLTSLSAELAESEKVSTELRASVVADQKALAEALEKYAALSSSVQQREEEHANTQGKLSDCYKALEAAGSHGERLRQVQEQLLQSQQETAEARRQAAATTASLAELEQELIQKNNALQEKVQTLEDARVQVEQQASQLQALTAEVAKSQADKEDSVGAALKQLQDATDRAQDLSARLSAEQSKVQNLIDDLTTERSEREQLFRMLQEAIAARDAAVQGAAEPEEQAPVEAAVAEEAAVVVEEHAPVEAAAQEAVVEEQASAEAAVAEEAAVVEEQAAEAKQEL